jgi:hypothetical protein
MFPIDESNFTIDTQTEEEKATVGRSFAFDYTDKKFEITDGAVDEPTSIEAVKQWVELLIRTKPGKYPIYGDSFGVSTDELIGYKSVPIGFIYSELKREIQEGLALNPSIDSMSNYSASRDNGVLTINFTVNLKDGASGEMSVNV